jgi:hypothetical protein
MILPLTKHVGSLAVVLVGAHSSGPDQSSGFPHRLLLFSIHKGKCQYNTVTKVMIAS